MTETAAAGLRERKKELTRRQISDAATVLFLERGFDEVTVADVARAADVSAKTVFNYFTRKEDLFFDRSAEAVDLITRALEGLAPGETTLRALRRLLIERAGGPHPLGRMTAHDVPFWHTVERSPALRARLREAGEEAEAGLGALIARVEGAAPDDPWPRFKAAAAIAAFRTFYGEALRRIRQGEPEQQVVARYAAGLGRAFDALERGLEPGA